MCGPQPFMLTFVTFVTFLLSERHFTCFSHVFTFFRSPNSFSVFFLHPNIATMTFYCNEKRKSYVLNPRGKPLYEDANRFGTKMLEKMGWSKGKGLGVNLDGERSFIKVSHKVDQKGIGFEDRDDQWTHHENEFNSLLKALDNSAAPESEENNADDADELSAISFRGFGFTEAEPKPTKKKSITDTLSGRSLEEMSKNCKSRLHYKKFTRGKDLSKYSEKDLANIFGKKIVDDSSEKSRLDEEVAATLPGADSSLNNYGITTIETGTTITEYFHKKKTNLLKCSGLADDNSASSPTSNSPSLNDDEQQDPETKRRKKKKEKHVERMKPQANEIVQIDDDVQEQKEKKKKKSKKEIKIDLTADVIDILDGVESAPIEERSSKKKKKEKRTKIDEIGESDAVVPIETVTIIDDSPVAKSKKKRSKKRIDVDDGEAATAEVTTLSNPIISNLLSTLYHINYAVDFPIGQRKNANVSNAGVVSSIVSTAEMHQFAQEKFEINRYQAELFRFVDLDGFKNANLSDLTGYGFGKNIDLQITARTHDRNRINDLWDNALINKYGKDVIKTKKKQKYNLKTLKKKSLFKAI